MPSARQKAHCPRQLRSALVDSQNVAQLAFSLAYLPFPEPLPVIIVEAEPRRYPAG
jgi:hypothetical protein